MHAILHKFFVTTGSSEVRFSYRPKSHAQQYFCRVDVSDAVCESGLPFLSCATHQNINVLLCIQLKAKGKALHVNASLEERSVAATDAW